METSSRYPWGKGTVITVRQAASTLATAAQATVPNNKMWMLRHFIAQITATAAAGNRYYVVAVYSAAGTIVWTSTTAAPVAATQIGQIYTYPGLPASSTVRKLLTDITSDPTQHRDTSCPDILLTEGMTIRVIDTAGVAAGDVVNTSIGYVEYDA